MLSIAPVKYQRLFAVPMPLVQFFSFFRAEFIFCPTGRDFCPAAGQSAIAELATASKFQTGLSRVSFPTAKLQFATFSANFDDSGLLFETNFHNQNFHFAAGGSGHFAIFTHRKSAGVDDRQWPGRRARDAVQ